MLSSRTKLCFNDNTAITSWPEQRNSWACLSCCEAAFKLFFIGVCVCMCVCDMKFELQTEPRINDDPGKLLKLWFQSKKNRGGFNLNNPQDNISLIESKFIQQT